MRTVSANPSGLKVGGHQASCEAMVSIMTSLWFEALQPNDNRDVFVKIGDNELGAMTVQAPVPRFSEATGRVDHLGPRLGEHNAEVYGDLLGLTPTEIDNLHACGVL
jgi:crotonobetainyl-CoA:carnitine CoA-transferase CaiB-like acyl-CoA transferase